MSSKKSYKARRTTRVGRDYAQSAHAISLRRACRVIGIRDSVYRYQPDTTRDGVVIAGLQQSVKQYPAYGFSLLFKIFRRWGYGWNHKRVHRIYCRLNLNKHRRGKKRLPNRSPVSLSVPETINGCWSLDFMCDSLFCGRRFRTLNIVDNFSREALAVEIDVSLSAQRVQRVLDRVVAWLL